MAAAGLVIIMVGATGTTLLLGGGVSALIPMVLGLLAVFVTYSWLRLAPQALGESPRSLVLWPTG
jgi:hypothetical protein